MDNDQPYFSDVIVFVWRNVDKFHFHPSNAGSVLDSVPNDYRDDSDLQTRNLATGEFSIHTCRRGITT